ncbi:hypothetical protein DFP72DRAFT_1168090 [Ephemerocybe angulata]|uniref:Transmembrane protein n=1 Tax=Ephemerocybe angulata TaxID=980116 RepID=A0A8H6I2T2_9AGAR|nr:hypothetical protein DFP72DRAFT_1168090 [Tulosesus angulatus]
MPKNWMDPQEIARDSRIYGAFTLVLCGVAAWDVLGTSLFDVSIIRGKRPWRWPMVLYFVCRICMLLHIFAMAVNLNAISEIPCQQVTWISKVSDAIGTCCTSLILILRTRAVWHQDIKITIALFAGFAGQIAVWCQTFRYSRAKWNPQRNVCAVVSTAPRPVLVAVFAYTMAFDLLILLLCTYKLYSGHGKRNGSLAKLLLRDGIGYFVAAFGANLVQMVFAVLQLNPVMNIMCLPFALVVSVIAATTVFRNVFTAFDGFSSQGSAGPATLSGRSDGLSGMSGRPHFLNHQHSSNGAITANDIALGDYKTHHSAATSITVTKVVNVDIDQSKDSHDQTKSHGWDSDLSYAEKAQAI